MMLGKAILIICGVLTAGGIAGGIYRAAELDKSCYESTAQLDSHQVTIHPIDQVFRDYNGWRVYSRDPNDSHNLVEEDRYFDGHKHNLHGLKLAEIPEFHQLKALGRSPDFVVFRDLPENAQAQLVKLTYNMTNCSHNPFTHIEVHLPENQGISPGYDSNRDVHNPHHQPMQEVH